MAKRTASTPTPGKAASTRVTAGRSSPLARAAAVTSPALPLAVHVLSDSTGNLPNHMLTTFLTQFPEGAFTLHRWNFLSTRPKLDAALQAVADRGGIVFHALVGPAEKKHVRNYCSRHKLHCCDLTGQFVDFLARSSGVEPRPDVGALHEVSEEYRARIKALEFTLEHDDGLGLDTIQSADVVLAGVSRTSKTPTSIYLGQQGYRVANVALAIEVAPPVELLQLPREKVIGLLIDPLRLAEMRHVRRQSWQMSAGTYTDVDRVAQEIAWSRRLFNQQLWRTLDVTNSAIEETAARIAEIIGPPRSLTTPAAT